MVPILYLLNEHISHTENLLRGEQLIHLDIGLHSNDCESDDEIDEDWLSSISYSGVYVLVILYCFLKAIIYIRPPFEISHLVIEKELSVNA